MRIGRNVKNGRAYGDIAASTVSACSSGSLEPSPVIRALGRNDGLARGAIRFSFGRYNTDEDVEGFASRFA